MSFSMSLSKSLLLSCLVLLSSCNTLKVSNDPTTQLAQIEAQKSADPLKGFNRAMYSFNNTADRVIIKPFSKGYTQVLPKPARKGVSNFFSNLGEPWSAVNNLLQGKFDRALTSTFRFTVNSTVGILGLFDVATYYDVKPAKEDLGQTLAAWGVKPGPYLMLPLLGPSNMRDGFGFATSSALFYPNAEITDSSAGQTGLTILGAIDTRSKLLGTDQVLENQLDPYSFLKVAFEENRLNQLYDGEPPQEPEEDFDF